MSRKDDMCYDGNYDHLYMYKNRWNMSEYRHCIQITTYIKHICNIIKFRNDFTVHIKICNII